MLVLRLESPVLVALRPRRQIVFSPLCVRTFIRYSLIVPVDLHGSLNRRNMYVHLLGHYRRRDVDLSEEAAPPRVGRSRIDLETAALGDTVIYGGVQLVGAF